MKITLRSDLHLDFGDFSLIDTPEADVMVLASDIFVASELQALMAEEV
jgi:hypothetical protein